VGIGKWRRRRLREGVVGGGEEGGDGDAWCWVCGG